MTAVAMVQAERPGVSLSLPKSLAFEEWVAIGRRLCASSQVINWHIGDWWAFGTELDPKTKKPRYGDRAKLAAQGIFGLAFQSLINCGVVARAFSETNRRQFVVSFTHYQEVAALPPGQADALLAKAEAEMLSTRELRREVAAIRTIDRNERKRDYIDIRPARDEEPTEIISADEIIVELATELCKLRALSDRESGFLERALRRIARNDGRRTEEWTGEHDIELIVLLKEGKRPKHIAPLIDRTEGAVWRRIHKLGGIQNLIAQGSVEEWPIRKV
jgi:hypothetical protein